MQDSFAANAVESSHPSGCFYSCGINLLFVLGLVFRRVQNALKVAKKEHFPVDDQGKCKRQSAPKRIGFSENTLWTFGREFCSGRAGYLIKHAEEYVPLLWNIITSNTNMPAQSLQSKHRGIALIAGYCLYLQAKLYKPTTQLGPKSKPIL